MAIHRENYERITWELKDKATLVAVSKTKPVEDIRALYDMGQRDFGENYVQELAEKAGALPKDIRWHFIGHLQGNKVRYIASFVQLIHGVDSLKLLKEIHKQGIKQGRVIDCLLQVHIAREETKFGLDEAGLDELTGQLEEEPLTHARIRGLMGMASFSNDMDLVRSEFRYLAGLFRKCREAGKPFTILSMGMSGDYQVALEEGSNMVRIGSLLFGARETNG